MATSSVPWEGDDHVQAAGCGDGGDRRAMSGQGGEQGRAAAGVFRAHPPDMWGEQTGLHEGGECRLHDDRRPPVRQGAGAHEGGDQRGRQHREAETQSRGEGFGEGAAIDDAARLVRSGLIQAGEGR